MTTPDPKSLEFFQKTWQVYRKIVDENYMSHREIFHEVAHILEGSGITNARILDLGCGDGGTMTAVLEEVPFASYLGLDASEPALALARKSLTRHDGKVFFICSDMLDFLRIYDKEKFDVIVVSFALHHLQPEEKSEFLALCKSILTNQGQVIIIDVFRRSKQSREAYLDDYCDDMAQRWTALSTDELAMVTHHVRNFDFPESFEEFVHIAESNNLRAESRASHYGYHGLLTLR